MFDDVTFTSREPLDADYAKRRSRWEPLYEITQMKGTGEAHPFSRATLDAMLDLANAGCSKIFQLQQQAVRATQ